MQGLLRWLASLKGIEVDPAEELQLELAAWPTGGLALLVLLGFIAAAVMVCSVYRRDAQGLTQGRRWFLAALRCFAVIAAITILLEPNLVAVKREERPGHAIMLLDVSQSMGHKDAYRREAVRPLADAWRELGIADPVMATRLDLAKALISHDDHALTRSLSSGNAAMLYSFSSAVEPLPLAVAATVDSPEGSPQQEENQQRAELSSIDPKGQYSNIGGAVRAAIERSRQAAIAAVVILSDGRRNVGPQGPEIARLLGQRKVPHTLILGIGDPSETQTIEVTRAEAPDKVFQGEPFRVRAHLASQGYRSMAVVARLLRMPRDGGEGTVVATKQDLVIGGDQPEAMVEFNRITSNDAGAFTYRVEIEPPEGEPLKPLRHGKEVFVEVLDQKTRVLLVAGGPSHEYRFVVNALKRDKTIELSCWLQSADADFPQDGNQSIDALPIDQKEMDEFDVLIHMDPNPEKLNAEFSELAAKHVVENGAGLWWICGDKFTLNALRSSASTRALASLLPIVPDMETADRDIYDLARAFPKAWPPELTSEGAAHPATRLLESKDENVIRWQQVPGVHFAFPVLRTKPAAQELVSHGNPQQSLPSGPMPLIVTQFVGAGRVLFVGTDEVYRWRPLFPDDYNRYWVKGIRYLYQGRLNAGNTRLRVFLDEETIELGETVKVMVDAKDAEYQPYMGDAIELRAERDGQELPSVQLQSITAIPGRFEAYWRPEDPGMYRLTPPPDFGGSAATSLRVQPAATEKEGPINKEELASIAAVSGGELFETPQDLLAALERVPSMTTIDVFRTPYAIWDTWVTIMLILLALTTEWWLRKRHNLL